MRANAIVRVLPLVILALGLGCASEPTSGTRAEEPAAEAAGAEAPVAVTAEAQTVLALADQADGEADHVVALCPGCGLAMEGHADYAMQVSDYSLHFCSDSCRDNFLKDTEAAIMALDLPTPEE